MNEDQVQNGLEGFQPDVGDDHHEAVVGQEAGEDVQDEVHQQAELAPQPNEKIEDDAGGDGEEEQEGDAGQEVPQQEHEGPRVPVRFFTGVNL